MPRSQPEQREPPVAWARLRYTKVGPARFTSARDVGRIMERALKRAQVPVAYSSGFNPHQRVSYAFPASTGAASTAEYAVVALARPMSADELQTRLNDTLPTGMRVTASLTGKQPLAPQLAASQWRLTWPGAASDTALRGAVAAFLAADTVIVERRSKSGVGKQDVRAAVVGLDADGAPSLVMVLRQSEPLIRPGDVVAGLRPGCPTIGDWGRGLLSRENQGALTPDGEVVALGD